MPEYCYQYHRPGWKCGHCGVCTEEAVPDVQQILEWLEDLRQSCAMETEMVPIDHMERWLRDGRLSGGYRHETGEFFSVIGIRTRGGFNREVSGWDQPMIHQREMGILGLLVQLQDGVDRYLVQGKAEPGNVHKVLISPTLQSTVSNLKRAHGGTKSRFASFFEEPISGTVLYDRHQAEDGGRFYLKTNRNMIVRVPDGIDLDPPKYFRWVTMAELKQLLQYENVVNVAVRSIISAV